MNKRIKELRKALGLIQNDFGARLGITGTAIARLEKGERNLTEQMFLAICREYHVNEEWLRTGFGEMFTETKQSFVERFSAEVGLSGYARKILECYLELDEHQRAVMDVFFKSIGDALSAGQSYEDINVDTAIETIVDRRHFKAAENSTNPKPPQLLDHPPEYMGRVEKAPDVNDTGNI